jgi:hypothetical protein
MDKNIAAILREDAKTIHVDFDLGNAMANSRDSERGGRSYTYVTHLDLEVGDLIVVPVVSSGWKVAKVIGIDDDLLIEPNSDMRYSWVIARIDTAAYQANALRNREIEQHLAASYRVSARQAYAMQFLGNASPEVLALVKGTK